MPVVTKKEILSTAYSLELLCQEKLGKSEDYSKRAPNREEAFWLDVMLVCNAYIYKVDPNAYTGKSIKGAK